MKSKKVYETRLDKFKFVASSLIGLALLLWFLAAYASWGFATLPHDGLSVLGWSVMGALIVWLISPSLCYY